MCERRSHAQRPLPDPDMNTPHILTSRDERVLSIELARREKKNALTIDMYRGLNEALEEAGGDQRVGAVLLRGQADLFTSGNDLADFLTPGARESGAAHRFLHAISGFAKPIVAAVGGPAIGIGTTMLMHCDIVVASDSARFQLPFVKLGLCPEAGSSLLLPQMAGHRLAAELLLLGDFFDAEMAKRAGIVNAIVSAEAVLEHGMALAKRLSQQPADALLTTKALLRRPLGRSVQDAIAEEYTHFERLLASDEARANFQAFLAKR
jgi:enoyl-CoA hydratase/carnithine racemase